MRILPVLCALLLLMFRGATASQGKNGARALGERATAPTALVSPRQPCENLGEAAAMKILFLLFPLILLLVQGASVLFGRRVSLAMPWSVGEEEAKKPYKYDCLYSKNEKPVSEIELKPCEDPGEAAAMKILFLLFPLILLLVQGAAACEDPGEAAAMKILFLLFPLILLLVQGASGSSLAPTNKEECRKENGYCGFLKCSFPFVISGKCSRFFFCCKKTFGVCTLQPREVLGEVSAMRILFLLFPLFLLLIPSAVESGVEALKFPSWTRPRFWLLAPCADVPSPRCLCRAQLG
ncbi:hypothetical protein DUI87_05654 [Hirundo rustica rustica]|uniref:Beta-defensin-like domain-containing protein n=1 Tax=Hirundo rustica rustica TaxID=333673 RepID=A0A3M0LD78_HIRRU|nr:hypothetical protein DUI87_05654 [Hirundo rustica rustica]